ncbi:uncharacterized protein [Watersipora subatra]|uniref:uncharacterized protein n=1 Tax=Watersipora subatra TaxID=2589382 RepID=UPI00355B2E59
MGNIRLVLLVNLLQISWQQEVLHVPVETESGTVVVIYERYDSAMSCSLLSRSGREECKYYEECCYDPVRIREVLEPGTYQCQNIGTTQGYVVNSCPQETEEEVSRLCALESSTKEHDLSISRWPVTGTYTGITYSNMYCAICNGALSPVTNNNISEVFDSQKALEYWTIEVYCDNATIELIESDERYFVTAEELQKHLRQRSCWTTLHPTNLGIYREGCGNYITHCPDDYPKGDLKDLCDKGPTNEVCVNSSDLYFCQSESYKNVFCQICWKNRTPNILKKETAESVGTLLLRAQPISWRLPNVTEFRSDSFSILPNLPRYFISLHNNDDLNTLPLVYERGADEAFWNLGSILCQSNYSRICGEFIVYPEEGECSLPGCGEGRVQDLLNKCAKVDSYAYNPESTFNRSFLWADSLLAKSLSTCENGVEFKNCRCDQRCHYFGDCCLDAPPLPAYLTITPFDQSDWTCYNVYHSYYEGLIVIDSCPDNMTETASFCESGVLGAWDLHGWLVSDKETKLTYKNIYCASCNGASDIIFWDVLMDCSTSNGKVTGECSFHMYILPTQHADIFCPCILGTTFISSCPDMFKGWRLDQDCRKKPASFVYFGYSTYRNSYCAICNLGDTLYLSTISPAEAYPSRTRFGTSFPADIGEVGYLIHRVQFSYDSKSCCSKCKTDVSEQCQPITNLTNSEWGSTMLPFYQGCTRVPFHINCPEVNEVGMNVVVNSMTFNYLCPGVSVNCFVTTTTTAAVPTLSTLTWYPLISEYVTDSFIGHIDGIDDLYTEPHVYISTEPTPVVIAGVFSDKVAASDQAFAVQTKEQWLSVSNETYWFCPDRMVVTNSSDDHFYKILLGSGDVQLRTYKNITETKMKKRSKLHLDDFILIALSLSAIVFYLIYLLIFKRKRLTTADKMMMVLLGSLFGALICFAFITTPPANDLIGCQLLAALTQFFFLSSLTWSSSMAISIVRTLHTFLLHRQSRLEFLCYTIYSFGLPLACTSITYILSTADIQTFTKRVYETEVLCFIGETIVLYALFLAPVYLLLLLNFVLGAIAIVKVSKSGNVGSSRDKNRVKKQIISSFKLSVSLGLGWVLLFFVTLYDKLQSRNSSVLWKTMQAFVELQGVLIVLSTLIGWKCLQSAAKRLKPRTSTSQSDSTKVTSATESAETRALTGDIPMQPTNEEEWDNS